MSSEIDIELVGLTTASDQTINVYQLWKKIRIIPDLLHMGVSILVEFYLWKLLLLHLSRDNIFVDPKCNIG